MAITKTLLTSGAVSSQDSATQDTASIIPTANRVIIAEVANYRTAAVGGISVEPTLSGNGLTWTRIDSRVFNQRRVTVYRADTGASPSSGVVTITCSNNQEKFTWSLVEWDGLDRSGTNADSAVRNIATNNSNGTAESVTLGAFANANNGTYAAFAHRTGAYTVGSGFEQLHQVGSSLVILSEWKDSNDTSVDATGASATDWGVVAFELVAAPGAQTISGVGGIAVDAVIGTDALVQNLTGVGAVVSDAAPGASVLNQKLITAGVVADEQTGTLTLSQNLLLAGVISPEQVGTQSLLQNLLLAGVATPEAVGVVTITAGGLSIITTGIAAGEAVGVVQLLQQIQAQGVSAPGTPGSASLLLTILALGIASGEAVGTVELELALVLLGIAAGEAIGSLSLSQPFSAIAPLQILGEARGLNAGSSSRGPSFGSSSRSHQEA